MDYYSGIRNDTPTLGFTRLSADGMPNSIVFFLVKFKLLPDLRNSKFTDYAYFSD